MVDIEKEIGKVLNEYHENIVDGMNKVSGKVARKGAKVLRATSPRRTGGYAAGWRVTKESNALIDTNIVHNAKKPGLPHLLERGHANKYGGRTAGKVHIKPVEQEMIQEYEEGVVKVAEDG